MQIDPGIFVGGPGAINTGGIAISGQFNLYPVEMRREKGGEAHSSTSRPNSHAPGGHHEA